MKFFFILLLCFFSLAQGQSNQPLGIGMEGYDYPYPVQYFTLTMQDQKLNMAYMDVKPKQHASKAVLLMHGKNFFGAYWQDVVADLLKQGYRAVVPDQIGFGKSSKPENLQYSLHQFASNTKALLDHLQIKKVTVAGHSMGGMLAARFALMFPETVEKLVLVNPIGLEDYRMWVPYQTIDKMYQQELNTSWDKLRDYQKINYYHGNWKEEYGKWIEPIYRMTLSPEYGRVARISALTYEMIYTQPVVHEFGNIRVPTLLIIGQLDRTALGKNLASEEAQKTLGNYPELGRRAARTIPNAKLVELPGVGHVPHVEAYQQFVGPFMDFLKQP